MLDNSCFHGFWLHFSSWLHQIQPSHPQFCPCIFMRLSHPPACGWTLKRTRKQSILSSLSQRLVQGWSHDSSLPSHSLSFWNSCENEAFIFLQHLLSSKINSLMFSVIILVMIREELLEGEASAVGPGAKEVGRDRVLKMLSEVLDLALTGVNNFQSFHLCKSIKSLCAQIGMN